MISSKKIKNNLRGGFSLVEFIISISIVSVMAFVIYNLQGNIFYFNRVVSSGLNTQDEIRRTLKVMSSEIRTSSPSSLGSYPIVQVATSSFIFFSNIDSDIYKERIRYFLDGTILKRGIIKPSGSPLTYNPASETISVLINGIVNGTSPVFNYYDSSYDGTSGSLVDPVDLSRVRLVKISVSVDNDPNSPPGPINLVTQVSMRNLKDNL